ncbi:MAG TPA: GNAT family N-acetyltransferase, partial [Bacteroidetes bacterium]|nr:GNAT family N-acetyltransferase [Bacteroidota bacterium]
MKNIKIKKGQRAISVQIMEQLPEFDHPYNLLEVKKRTDNTPHLNLIAYVDEKPAGFKLGYERNGCFYSWLGGVLPEYRRMGIAKKLADEQEKWARENNYKTIVFKTRNRHKAMLLFSLNNGFDIFKIE